MARKKTHTAPAVVSIFFPGVGQIMKDEVAKGLLLMFAYWMAVASMFIIIGFFIVPVLYAFIIYDAYKN